ncbi:hypothetical protein ACTGZW_11800, partial [Streptococcus suis]
EYHNLRYTREKGKSKMEDKIGLTLACLNLKKLVKRMARRPFYTQQKSKANQSSVFKPLSTNNWF